MIVFTKPYLQPYKGISTRHECPECRTKKSFTLYLDGNTNEPINRKVGKCNRESKCGYHYSPKQYFYDNPTQSKKSNNKTTTQLANTFPSLNPMGEIPVHFVNESLSGKSNFVVFLTKFRTIEEIKNICAKYKLGATKTGEVIFWQIDINGIVRTGKIMQYNPATGKRIKNDSGAIDWVHSRLKKAKIIQSDFNLRQCFFGEHLLRLYPCATIAIVEGEKSALIGSLLIRNLIWISAGSINGLNIEKCKVLEGRKIVLYPDLGAFDKWKSKAAEIEKTYNCKIGVSELLEQLANDFEIKEGYDIADFIISELIHNNSFIE